MEIGSVLNPGILNTAKPKMSYFLWCLHESNEDLIGFLLAQKGKHWIGIRNNLITNTNGEFVLNHTKLETLKRYLSRLQERSSANLLSEATIIERQSTPSPISTPASSEVDERNQESIRVRKRTSNIKGKIETYEIDMMGSFNFTVSQSKLRVSESSKIRRPIKVTGVLGSKIAGDHVIPLSLFVDNLRRDVIGKDPSSAINSVLDTISELGADYLPLIREARLFTLSQYGSERATLENQLKAYNFLKSELIPGVTAIWNQKIGSAFYSKKTRQERIEEAGRIKSILKEINESINEEVAYLYIKGIDYGVKGSERSVSSNSAEARLMEGKRTNHFSTLSYILGNVVEYYISQYSKDHKQNLEITIVLLSEFFKKNPEWVEHYNNHTRDLGRKSTTVNNQNITNSTLSKWIIDDIIKTKPSLLEEALLSVDQPKNKLKRRNISLKNESGKKKAKKRAAKITPKNARDSVFSLGLEESAKSKPKSRILPKPKNLKQRTSSTEIPTKLTKASKETVRFL